jgi:hypothetical protein
LSFAVSKLRTRKEIFVFVMNGLAHQRPAVFTVFAEENQNRGIAGLDDEESAEEDHGDDEDDHRWENHRRILFPSAGDERIQCAECDGEEDDEGETAGCRFVVIFVEHEERAPLGW